jgi:hypothetical protein
VRVLIELPKSQYDLLRSSCDFASKEFRLLINGCIETRDQEQVFQIICAESEAAGLLELAQKVHPGAADIIRSAIQNPAATSFRNTGR